MRDWNSIRENKKKKLVDWLALDAYLDSSMYDTLEELRNRWGAYSDFLARFHLGGYKRVLSEILSESFTMVTFGMMVIVAMALPAFEETNKNWRAIEYSVTFLDRYGNFIGTKGIKHDDAVPFDEIPKHMIQATLATEDRRFYEHFGIDIQGTIRALIQNMKSKSVQGGSSITQQLAKNLFLTKEQTLLRKINELFLAFWLEGHFSKDEILEMYLERAYLGGGAHGVEAASQYYFGKSVRDISLAEAAILAGMYKAPSQYAPHVNLPLSRARANEVLSNLVEAGYMTEGQVHGARLNPASVVQQPDEYIPHYFLDWAFNETKKLARGKDDYVLTVRTTVDTELQKFAQKTVREMLEKEGRTVNVRQGALVSMEHDGAVRAIVGGKDYNRSKFNRATQGRRQPGSSFKPYVYLAALQSGRWKPNTIVSDRPISCGGKVFKNYTGRYSGGMRLADALKKSINTVALDLSYKLGRENVVKYVKQFNLTIRKSCSLALGDWSMSPLEHTAGYAAFANGGKVVKPYGVLEIRNSKDEVIYTHEKDGPKPVQVFKKKNIEDLNYMLGLVMTEGTGGRGRLDFTASAGKTGTTSNYKDGWFIGYTGAYVTGVWYGNDSYLSMNRSGTGGNLPARTWKEYMVKAHESIRPNIPKIPGIPLHETQQEELQQLALLQGSKPKEAKVVKTVEILPKRTRTTLTSIAKLLEGAQPLGKQANNDNKNSEKKAAN